MSTKTELLARCARLERTVDPLEMALHDMIHGDVTWFGRGDCRVGVSRPRGACGGIVVWQFEGNTGADYFEQANEVWKNFRLKDRLDYIREHRSQFEFRDFSDMLGCVRGNYFAGYASELIS